MTAEPADLTPVPDLIVTTATKAKTKWVALDGHPLLASRTKAQWLIDQATLLQDLSEDDPRQIDTIRETVEKVFRRPEDRDHLYARLRDEDDDFDYEDLGGLFKALREQWGGGRPTGSSTASSSPPGRRGGRSTARRR